ncbi:hypothetical protein LCGC14_2075990 [marine sediment metagenome]|uniref:Uncharacterized protein n=1 Tax=marine sediment metagenome TaxID=412755 RepID=A0A0F9F4E5_9ZZZZ
MTLIFNERTKIDGKVDIGSDVISDATAVVDLRALSVLEQILITLKKIEYHLFLGTDTELKDQDV